MKILTAVLGLVVAACTGGGKGGGSGGDTGAISQQDATMYCQQSCDYNLSCDPGEDVASCVAMCVADVVGWAREDAVETIVECRVALPCDVSDDRCLLEILPLAIHQQWEDRCRIQLAACSDPAQLDGACEVSPSPDGGDGGPFRLIAPAIMVELLTCLDRPVCEDRVPCVQGVLELHGINF